MDIGLLYAIFRRLTGLPLDSSGRPAVDAQGIPKNAEKSFGLRIPAMKSKNLTDKSSRLSSFTPSAGAPWKDSFEGKAYRQVPIFVDGMDNRDWSDVYPCCSISYSDVRIGEGGYWSLPGDGGNLITQESGSRTVVDPDTGETLGTAPDSRVTRPHPVPYSVEMVFTLQATNLIEMMMLERAFLALWDGKLGLLMTHLGGETVRADYQFSRYIVMDQGEPYNPQQGIEGSGPAALRRGFVFTFETWLDNSTDGYNLYENVSAQTILESYLEVCNIRDKGLAYEQSTVIETIRIG